MMKFWLVLSLRLTAENPQMKQLHMSDHDMDLNMTH